jgi:excinuclease UvrABC ATPase subunit
MAPRNRSPGRYCAAKRKSKSRKHRRALQLKQLKIRGAGEHNLKSINVNVPLNMLVCVTGVSGSGKSTLIHDCIYAGLKKEAGEWQGHVGRVSENRGNAIRRRSDSRRSITHRPHAEIEPGNLHKGL